MLNYTNSKCTVDTAKPEWKITTKTIFNDQSNRHKSLKTLKANMEQYPHPLPIHLPHNMIGIH